MKNIYSKTLFAMLPLIAQSAFAGGAKEEQQQRSISFEELKVICRNFEGGQYREFNSPITCKEQRIVWKKIGEQRFNLSAHSEVSVKAIIKDGKKVTDWWTAPSGSTEIEASCPVYEQWRVYVSDEVAIQSCKELVEIESEEAFCEKQLAPKWERCEAAVSQTEQVAGQFQAPVASECSFENMNIVKSCTDTPVVPEKIEKPTCPVQQPDVDQVDQNDQAGQMDQQTGDVCVMPVAEQVFDLGASLTEVRVNRWRSSLFKYNIIELNDVREDGFLYRLGLRDGYMVVKVDGDRMRTRDDFMSAILKARKKGKVRIEYRVPGSSSTKKLELKGIH